MHAPRHFFSFLFVFARRLQHGCWRGHALRQTQGKLEAAAAAARGEAAHSSSSVAWRGLSLPVGSEATRLLLLSAADLATQIEATEARHRPPPIQRLQSP